MVVLNGLQFAYTMALDDDRALMDPPVDTTLLIGTQTLTIKNFGYLRKHVKEQWSRLNSCRWLFSSEILNDTRYLKEARALQPSPATTGRSENKDTRVLTGANHNHAATCHSREPRSREALDGFNFNRLSVTKYPKHKRLCPRLPSIPRTRTWH